MHKNLLIIGSSGFIGKNLIEHFINNDKYKIYATYNNTKLKSNHQNITYIHLDLSKKNYLSLNKLKKINFDSCIFLTWIGIPDLGIANSIINCDLIIRFFDYAFLNLNFKNLIVTGSCFEYHPNKGKCSEDININFDHSPFTYSKFIIYNYLSFKCNYKKIKFYWLRLFYVYGPYQRELSLIPYLLNCKRNNTLPKITNLHSAQDFIHVSDVCESIVAFIERNPESGIYNIGTGILTSLIEIYNLIYNTNKNYRTKNFPNDIYANINKVRRAISWHPKIKIKSFINEKIN